MRSLKGLVARRGPETEKKEGRRKRGPLAPAAYAAIGTKKKAILWRREDAIGKVPSLPPPLLFNVPQKS